MSDRWPPPSAKPAGIEPGVDEVLDVAGVGADDQVVGAVAAGAQHVGQRDLLDLVVHRLGVEVAAERGEQEEEREQRAR